MKKRKSKKGIVTTKRRSAISVKLGKLKRQAWDVLGGLGLLAVVLWLVSLAIGN